MCDARVVALGAFLISCGESTPRVVPSIVDVDEQGPLRIEGLGPDDFLVATSDSIALVSDFRAQIGVTGTSIVSADATGVTVMTDVPLDVGTYALSLQASGHSWFVDPALEVVQELSDAGTDAPARECPAAPSGCTSFSCTSSTSCYYVCDAKTAAASEAQCESKGIGCLVTISDAAENACVATATQPQFPDLIWIGFTQASNASEPAGGWSWRCSDGTSFVAPNWGGFEPNDEEGEDCGAMADQGAWIDGDCLTTLRYVCELP